MHGVKDQKFPVSMKPFPIHQGDPNTASHGCVHVAPPFAEQLFEWAGSTDIWVIVMG
jgi:lipoprotein-anchoring transpeptidase ErfK/SrfK